MSLTEPLAREGTPPDAPAACDAAPGEAVGGDGELEGCGGVVAGGRSGCGRASTSTSSTDSARSADLAGGAAPVVVLGLADR